MLQKTLDEALAEFTQLHDLQSATQLVSPVVTSQAAWLKKEGVSLLHLQRGDESGRYALHNTLVNGNPTLETVPVDQPIWSAMECHQFDRHEVVDEMNIPINLGRGHHNPWSVTGMASFRINRTGTAKEYLDRLLRVFGQCHADCFMGVFGWKIDRIVRDLRPLNDLVVLEIKAATILLDEIMDLRRQGILDNFSVWIEAKSRDPLTIVKVGVALPENEGDYWKDHDQRLKVIRDQFEHELMQHM